MKEGPGSDLFVDDEPDSDPDDADSDSEDADTRASATTDSDTSTSSTTTGIPYTVRRQTVKEDRTHELAIFARDEFQELEDEVRRAVADELGMSPGNVPVTDIREAYIEVARRNPEDMAAVLDEWGYEHLR
ncbi:hypothetical protein [Haloarcula sp. JP-L23]|uniref:hypothetical protein n=1 Tax=Haloarcula sp. JP-L23 TaxID=2716717 RepID=UPI001D051EB0